MARINIEDSLYQDHRFLSLCIKFGSIETALGAMVRVWSVAQKFYVLDDRKIPREEWVKQGLNDAVIEVGLAENVDGRVRVAGVDEQFKWLLQRIEAGRRGGQAVGKRKEAVAKRPLAGAKPLTLTLPLTLDSKELNTSPTDVGECVSKSDIEAVYSRYPRKEGKSDGMKRLKTQIKTPEDLKKFSFAVEQYRAKCERDRTEPRYIKHFSSFVSEWRDWVDPSHGQSIGPTSKLPGIQRKVDHDLEIKEALRKVGMGGLVE